MLNMEIFANIYLNMSEFMSAPRNDKKMEDKKRKKNSCRKDTALCVAVHQKQNKKTEKKKGIEKKEFT